MTAAVDDVLDPAALDRLLRIGGQAFVVEMIELFLEHAPGRLEAAVTGTAARDYQTLYRAAHSLKSTAGNLGAHRLQAAAERLEQRAAAGDEDAVGPLLLEMQRRYEQVRERLEAERNRRQRDEAHNRETP